MDGTEHKRDFWSRQDAGGPKSKCNGSGKAVRFQSREHIHAVAEIPWEMQPNRLLCLLYEYISAMYIAFTQNSVSLSVRFSA